MAISLKELIVVLAIASVIFRLAKPIALRFSHEQDYSRRRNIWLALTVTAFLSPNFWLFTLVATPLLMWAGGKDKNPIALYLLMLHVIPPLPLEIPVPAIKSLFALDNYRLLSLCVLVPAAWRLRTSKDTSRIRGMTSMDILVLAYGVLQIALYVPPDTPNHIILPNSFTNDLRRFFLYFIDVYIVFYMVSRSCSSRELIKEAQAAFCLSCAIMAALAVFETVRHWLLYTDIALRWSGDVTWAAYKFRGGGLRAQASTTNTLALGYLLAIGCGFWLYLESHIRSRISRFSVLFLLSLGVLATYSRGPTIGLIIIYVVVLALRPGAFTRLFKGALAALLFVILIGQSPLGDRIAHILPFMKGSADEQADSSITYRQRLAERSWELINEHPFFGDQLALQKMEDLRQGEGIIDLVNTYAAVTVFYGFVGLAIFISAMLIALSKAYRTAKKTAQKNPDLALMGISLVGCIVGTLFMLATCSFLAGYDVLFYVIAGFAATYANVANLPKPDTKAYGPVSRSPELR